jgi:molybdate transport system substrate-binding protein
MASPGIELVGALPAKIQLDVVFAAGLSTSAKNANAGPALTRFLVTPDAITVMKVKGLDPA